MLVKSARLAPRHIQTHKHVEFRQQTIALKAVTLTLVICSITRFRNWVPGCNYPGTRFQLLS